MWHALLVPGQSAGAAHCGALVVVLLVLDVVVLDVVVVSLVLDVVVTLLVEAVPPAPPLAVVVALVPP